MSSAPSSLAPAVLGSLDFESRIPITLIIDGPSGAGKTTLACDLRDAWPTARTLEVVHLDDIYPGWLGLQSASEFIARVLDEERPSRRDFEYHVWDWALEKYGTKRRVSGGADVIIEGCGALTQASAGACSLSVWVDADDALRKTRALSRSDEDFEEHWDEWDEQFREFIRRENPQAHASLTIAATR